MKRIFTIMTFAVLFSALASAQDYNKAIGLRGGLYNGITFKQFLGGKAAIELLGATRWSGIGITGLYEIHNRAFDVDRLNWYFGGGAHVGFYNGNNTTWGDAGTSYVQVGLDLILGIEYNFTELPVNISLDWKPALDVVGYSGFWADGAAISIRYIW